MIKKIFNSGVGKNLVSNFFGVGVNLFSQILLLPFFLKYWGVAQYGDWIILTAFTTFFAMSDIGFNTVSANLFAIKVAENKNDDCKKLLTNNFFILFVVTIIVFGLLYLFVSYSDIKSFLGLHTTTTYTAKIVLLLLIANVFIGMYSGVFNSIYRAYHKAHKSTYIDNISRLLEAGVLLIGLITNLNLIIIVLIYNVPKIILLFYKIIDTKKLYIYKFNPKDFDIKLLKKVFIPSVSFMSFPIGYTIIQQGFTLLINKFFGANILVLFNTTRTMSNFLKTILGTIATAIWPEFTLAFGKKDFVLMRKIHRRAVIGSFIISVLIAFVFIFFGEFIFNFWTKHQLIFNYKLLITFLIVLMINNLWYTSSVTLMATNQHAKLGVIFLLSSSVALIFAYALGGVVLHSLLVCTASLVIIEVSMSVYTFKKSMVITGDNFKDFILNVKS